MCLNKTRVSLFSIFPTPAWGKNYHSSLLCPSTYRTPGHTRPLRIFAPNIFLFTHETVTVSCMNRKMLWWPSWLARTYSKKPEPWYRANFLTSLWIARRLSNESGKWKSCWVWNAFYLLVQVSVLNWQRTPWPPSLSSSADPVEMVKASADVYSAT